MNTIINKNGQPIKTLLEAVKYFSDLNIAHECFVKMRWDDGVICPRCGSRDVRFSAKYRRFECSHRHPLRQFTVKTGTIMEDSPMSLDKWAVAFWLEVNAKNSISSWELHRALGITQKSAWFMLHRIRLAVKSSTFEKIGGDGGIVEVDETFVGGKSRNMHKDRRERTIKGTGGAGKTAVMGLLERHSEKGKSKVRAAVVENTRRNTLYNVIHQHVESGTHLMTDSLKSYQATEDYMHSFIDHAEKYVDGIVHTNGMENFWSLFKRCIKGTHISIEPFHLAAYVDSEAFRFNNRDLHDGQRFMLAVKGMSGKRLTYKALTGALELAPASDKDAGSAGGNLPN